VAKDYRAKTCCGWIEIQFRQIVQHVHAMRPKFEDLGLWKACGPRTLIVIATNCADRRNSGQRIHYRRISDIPSMND
jgi:hypothetical protein